MSSVNRIVQIGYDYLVADEDRRKELEHDLNAELERQGIFSKKTEILHKIATDFGLI